MEKRAVHERLVSESKITFGKGVVTLSEYSRTLTKEEREINEMMIKTILAKIFGGD